MHVIWKCEQVYLIHGWLWSRALKDARWRDDTLHHVTISWTAQECRPTVGYSNSGFMSYWVSVFVITAHYTGWIDRGNECVKEGGRKQPKEKENVCMCVKQREREQQKTSFLLLSLRLHYVCQSLSICACVPVCVFVCKVRYGNSAI